MAQQIRAELPQARPKRTKPDQRTANMAMITMVLLPLDISMENYWVC